MPDTSSIPGYTIYRDADSGSSAVPAPAPAHPLDQLSIEEVPYVAKLIRTHLGPDRASSVKFNAITLREPLKREYAAFKAATGPRPDRRAFAIVLEHVLPPNQAVEAGQGKTTAVAEVIVNLTSSRVESWTPKPNVGALLTLEDLDVTERVARADPRVVDVCREIGITDMAKVYLDAWAIGVDERWGLERRLQQGLAYYRNSPSDNQYAHPLDFAVVVDTEAEVVLSVDVRRVNGERTPVSLQEHNYLPEFIGAESYKHDRLKPIDITQPEGVSFRMHGDNEIEWAGFLKMHIGFNYREGIVLSDVRAHDMYEDRERTLFNRLSVVEMVVPYGNPDPPHHKKHAFDVGEYGTGLMTNSLKLGCDCKGAIHYLDGVVSTAQGHAALIKNAICIHEEDNGLLYKHTDYRDGSVTSARDRKLIISQIITAANYEYGFYHVFSLDGTYKLEVKLTGMLNTYCMHPTLEGPAAPYGTEVAPYINAHNHQHIFSLRVDPEIDGPRNTVIQNDAVPSEAPVGSAENPFGNGFYCQKTALKTAADGAASYRHETSRTWDICNPHVLNPASHKPVAYKILNANCPPLLAKPGSVVHARAAFARKSLWVVPYRDHELFPAGDYVCQSVGRSDSDATVEDWVARGGAIDDADIVCYVQFGLTHFPRTEDFPIMPAEPVGVMLRASHFFQKNPALWVPPSDQAGSADKASKDAFAKPPPQEQGQAASCCAASKSKL